MKCSLWLCGIVLVSLLTGCGGNVNGEGEGFDYPQVTEGNRTTDPELLGSAGGRVTIEASMFRRGSSYLVPNALPPTFSVLTPSNRFLVKEQRFTFESKLEPSDDSYSGDYCGSFTVRASKRIALSSWSPVWKVVPIDKSSPPLLFPHRSGYDFSRWDMPFISQCCKYIDIRRLQKRASPYCTRQ